MVLSFFRLLVRIMLSYTRLTVFTILQLLIPKHKKIWIYGTRNGFLNDNTKYLLLEACALLSGIKHIWICNSLEALADIKESYPSIRCYLKKSWWGCWYALRAKVHIYNSATTDISLFYHTINACLVNLWHGIPLKQIEYDVKTGPSSKRLNSETFTDRLQQALRFERKTQQPNILLSPSLAFNQVFQRAFRVPSTHLVNSIYPRLLPLLQMKQEYLREAYIQRWKEQFARFNHVFIYMPTWRDANRNFFAEAIPDLDLLNEHLKIQQSLLVVKMHINSLALPDTRFSNICFFENNLDIYPLLPFSHALISDYSSIIFDYMLMPEKKVIFYPFDKQVYIQQSRELYFEYETILFTAPAYTFDDLLKRIAEVQADTFETDLNKKRELIYNLWNNLDTPGVTAILEKIQAFCM